MIISIVPCFPHVFLKKQSREIWIFSPNGFRSIWLYVCHFLACFLFYNETSSFCVYKIPCIQISWTFFHLQFSRRRMAYKIWYNSPNTTFRAFFMHSQFSSEIMKLPPFSFYRSLSTFLFYPCMIFTERYIMFYAWYRHEIFQQGT